MADHVYRRFTFENQLATTILAEPYIEVSSGSAGWTGNTNTGNNSLSLYGGVRSRADTFSGSTSGLQLYPLDTVDTQTIDGVIQVPGQYPQTGSINLVLCTNTEQPDADAITDTRWYDEHHSVIRRLAQWYHDNYKHTYQQETDYPDVITVFHIPEMFYGRQIATGSVLLQINSFSGTYTFGTSSWGMDMGGHGPLYIKDDGYGRLWWVPTTSSAWNVPASATQIPGNVFYNEGLIVFTTSSAAWHSRLMAGPVSPAEPHVTLGFRGQNPIKSMVFMCRLGPSEANGSNNPTYYVSDSDGKRWAAVSGSNEATTYITAIGLYNEHRQLVGVVKSAQPIRKRERDNIDIRIRFDV